MNVTKDAKRDGAARAPDSAARSNVRAQRLEHDSAAPNEGYRPGGDLRAPLAENLVWARVLRPSIPLVYLDLNHYINLAKASPKSRTADAVSKPGMVLPGYADLGVAARDAKASGRAMFPLSGIHMMEMLRIKDPRQRADVAAVMEELSGFHYLLDRSTLAQLEMDAGLDHLQGETKAFGDYLPLIAQSFAYSVGRNIDLTIKDADGQDSSAEVRRRMGERAFSEMVAAMNLKLERKMLSGPADEQLAELGARGWNPETVRQAHESRLGFELETRQTLIDDPEWLRGDCGISSRGETSSTSGSTSSLSTSPSAEKMDDRTNSPQKPRCQGSGQLCPRCR